MHPLTGEIVRYVLLSALLGLLAAWLGLGPKSSPAHIQIEDAWVHETTESRAVLHLRIKSTGARGDQFVRASAELAQRIVIINQQGKETRALGMPAGSTWVMEADSPRVELVGLTRALKAGDTFGIQLVFEWAGKIQHVVRVVGS
jgi:copper(I)-binding protein